MTVNQLSNLKEKQQEEALKRLTLMGVCDEVKKTFLDGKVFVSELQGPMLLAVLMDVNDELAQEIKEVEERSDILIFHIQKLNLENGPMYSMFYVSKHEHEWELDIEDLKRHEAVAYVVNGDIKEYGYIGFKAAQGGVVRTF